MLRQNRGAIRIVVVDDSPTACELLISLFQEEGGMEVVGVGANGEDAVRLVRQLRPDVVTMDVRMPKMDGLEATRRIMHEIPTPIVIVTASTMRSDMDLTFEALQAGALTVVRKPGLADPETCDKVVQAVRLMSEVPVIRRWDKGEARRTGAPEPGAESGYAIAPSPGIDSLTEACYLEPEAARRIQRIGIAASTGGPAVLAKILGPLPADFPAPILVVQHITRGFSIGLAEWLDSTTALSVNLAGHGELPRPGTVLLSPDDYHMRVSSNGVVELSKEPPYRGVRPSADYLFHSLAETYGPRSMGVVLTGMGDDGAEGAVALHRAGGVTIAQEERSCIVYGMPREVIIRNAASCILTPEQIAKTLLQIMQANRSVSATPAERAVQGGGQ